MTHAAEFFFLTAMQKKLHLSLPEAAQVSDQKDLLCARILLDLQGREFFEVQRQVGGTGRRQELWLWRASESS
jgi:hypothetical protein